MMLPIASTILTGTDKVPTGPVTLATTTFAATTLTVALVPVAVAVAASETVNV